MEFNQLTRHWPLQASNHRPPISCQQRQPSNDKRPLRYLVYRSEEFPNRMASKSVVLGANSESRHQRAVLGRPNFSMVQTHLIGERPCFPTLHPRGDNCDVVHAACLHRYISTNCLEAGSSEQLARARDVFDTHEAIVVGRTPLERRSDQSECGILSEFAEQERKVAFVKRDVAIQAGDHLVLQIFNPRISGVKGMNLSSKIPFTALRHPDQLDPSVLNRISSHYVVRAVGRAVADDNPFGWSNRLAHHGAEGP